MTHLFHTHTLALAFAAALSGTALTDSALAQSAPSEFHVFNLTYAPSASAAALDLRPGPYLLQVRHDAAERYEGLLRGPRNEIVAERIRLAASSGCVAGLPSHAALTTRALAGAPGSNVLAIEVGNATGGCSLHGQLPALGLTAPEKPPQVLECDPPVEIQQIGTVDPGPTCSIEKWNPPLSAPRPDVKPGPVISIAGRVVRWTDHVRVSASEAVSMQDGRCVFGYAYAAENVGRVTSAASDASLLLGQRVGLQLDTRTLAPLPPGGNRRIQGQMALPPGIWQVFAHLDSSAQVGEWDGQNNARSLLVEVVGPCSPASAQ